MFVAALEVLKPAHRRPRHHSKLSASVCLPPGLSEPKLAGWAPADKQWGTPALHTLTPVHTGKQSPGGIRCEVGMAEL